MPFAELMILSLGLSMDACAVAICKGACMRGFEANKAAKIAIAFGFFQALMPLIGWFLGTQFTAYINSYDHWIAFILLLILGIKMIWDATHAEDKVVCTPLDVREVLLLAIATSIDALAAGVALAVLQVNIWSSILMIGLVTLGLSFLGTILGSRFGQKYTTKAQMVGGFVLCGIGIKILIEHLAA